MTGQYIIQRVGNGLNEYMKSQFGDHGAKYTIYSDTDSVFVTMDRVTEKLPPGLTEDQIATALDIYVKQKIDKVLDELTTGVSKQLNCMSNRLSFKREKIASSCFFCVHPDTGIATESGMKPISELTEGEMILNKDESFGVNKFDVVKHVMKKQFSGHMYKLTTPDGKTVKVTGSHLVLVKRDDDHKWVAAQHLLETDELVCV